jgi:hypothetical protein
LTATSRPARAPQAAAAVVLLLTLAACGSISPPASDDSANAAASPPATSPPATTPPVTSSPTAAAVTPSVPARSESPRAAGTPRGGAPAAVDERNPGAVAQAALATMYTSDTRIDTGPRNAIVRATRYMTPAYAAELTTASPPPAGAQWQQWVDHQAYTTATVSEANDAGRPADTATTAYRQYAVSVTAHGPSAYTDTAPVGTAFVELTRAGENPWRVSAIQLR